MIYTLTLGFLAFISLVLGSIYPRGLLLGGAAPDILLLLVVFNGMFRGYLRGGVTGFLIGLMEDLFMGRFIGMNALSKAIVGATTGYLTKSIFKENLWVPILNVGWGTLLELILFFLIGRLVGNQWPLSLLIWQGTFETIYNICLVPFLYGPFFNFADKHSHLIKRK
jgi:rod shape-determining protein MreD